MRKTWIVVAFAMATGVAAFAQGATAPKIDNDFVHKQFGTEFTYLPDIGVAVGDLDGDGIEDIAIAARCKNPMLDQADHNYQVIDPMNSFFGYGDPRITTTFSEGDPSRRGLVVLIIDGDGKDAWRSLKPKAKYVVVNIPYREISIRKLNLKKKTIEALFVKEAGGTGESSAVFYDGKKFRYVPMGGEME
jgi:hypothetical protein